MEQDTQGTADTGRLLAKKIRTSTPTKTCDDGGTKGGREEREKEREEETGGREEREREWKENNFKDKPQ